MIIDVIINSFHRLLGVANFNYEQVMSLAGTTAVVPSGENDMLSLLLPSIHVVRESYF